MRKKRNTLHLILYILIIILLICLLCLAIINISRVLDKSKCQINKDCKSYCDDYWEDNNLRFERIDICNNNKCYCTEREQIQPPMPPGFG